MHLGRSWQGWPSPSSIKVLDAPSSLPAAAIMTRGEEEKRAFANWTTYGHAA